MTYTLDHFKSLTQRFPAWTDLKEHLESDAGGKLRIASGPSPYAVIRYVKGQSDLRTAELGAGLFRSVVWDTERNMPVCVAPPKARNSDIPVGVNLAATEDFVDGFMMNVWTDTTGSLFLATRTQIGGVNTFYSETTFGAMFDDALASSPLKDRAGLAAALKPVAFASFVVQHPEHRIVSKITSATLYLVHVGAVLADASVQISERSVNWPQALGRLQIQSYPLRKFNTQDEVKDLLRRTAVQRGWRWQGLVFKDGAGGRWRLRSPTYDQLRSLRGSEASSIDRFLRLRADGKVVDYLKHYGDGGERDIFWGYEQKLRARTADVLTAYNAVHKSHSIAFKKLPEEYQPAVFRLHKLFLEQLREKGFKVRLQNVIGVVNEMKDFERRRLLQSEPFAFAVNVADEAVTTVETVETVEEAVEAVASNDE